MLIPITHLTVWYNYTLTHESVHNAEHLAFLVVGYLFWRQIFGSDPNCYRLHPALQFFYLFMAIPIDTFTGLSLAGASHEMFPAYFATHRTWGPSYVTDLHVGGDIMWVVGDTLMLWPMIPVALRWMHMDERKAVRIDRELDASGTFQLVGDGESGVVTRGLGPRRIRGQPRHSKGTGCLDRTALRLARWWRPVETPATRRRLPPARASCRTARSPTSRSSRPRACDIARRVPWEVHRHGTVPDAVPGRVPTGHRRIHRTPARRRSRRARQEGGLHGDHRRPRT